MGETCDNAPGRGRRAQGVRGRWREFRARLSARRERIRSRPALNTTYRVAIGVLGGLVLALGVVMIPYPGPGWLVVFAGLEILATEFRWARRVNHFARSRYRRWVHWLERQHGVIKVTVMAFTGLVVAATLWVLGVFALVGGWFGVHHPWLASPFASAGG